MGYKIKDRDKYVHTINPVIRSFNGSVAYGGENFLLAKIIGSCPLLSLSYMIFNFPPFSDDYNKSVRWQSDDKWKNYNKLQAIFYLSTIRFPKYEKLLLCY